MKDKNFKIVQPNESLKTILSCLEEAGQKILFCCSKDNELIGTITDGDIRRAILNYDTKSINAELICNKQPLVIDSNNIEGVINKAKRLKIEFVPRLKNKKLIEVISVSMNSLKTLPPVVLMAGGLGKRLGNLTKNKPKPLVKVSEDKTIIDVIIENLIKEGAKELYVTVNYKWEQIKEYLQKKYSEDIKIKFVLEQKQLGTAGSLFYLKNEIAENFIVMNADIITTLDFAAFIKFHEENKNLISVVANKSTYEISKGVIEYYGSIVKSIKEKPKKSYTYNAGIYAIKRECLVKLSEEYLDMPDLINNFVPTKKVGIFPLIEYWRDLGLPEDLEAAKKDIQKNEI